MPTIPLHRCHKQNIMCKRVRSREERERDSERASNEGKKYTHAITSTHEISTEETHSLMHTHIYVYFKTMSQQNYFALHFCNISTWMLCSLWPHVPHIFVSACSYTPCVDVATLYRCADRMHTYAHARIKDKLTAMNIVPFYTL